MPTAMADHFMDKLRNFLGLHQGQPRNDFRNPVWGDDENDDGDGVYERSISIEPHTDLANLHQEITKHMQSMLRTFSHMIIDDTIKTLFCDEPKEIPEFEDDIPDENQANSIRDYYLKPGFQTDQPGDMDLDGKISSTEMSGLLKKKSHAETNTPFDGNLVPGRSFCQTVITTSITKPDGTIETRKIVKNGNGVTEDVITTTSSPFLNPNDLNMDHSMPHDMDSFYKGFLRDFTAQFRNLN